MDRRRFIQATVGSLATAGLAGFVSKAPYETEWFMLCKQVSRTEAELMYPTRHEAFFAGHQWIHWEGDDLDGKWCP